MTFAELVELFLNLFSRAHQCMYALCGGDPLLCGGFESKSEPASFYNQSPPVSTHCFHVCRIRRRMTSIWRGPLSATPGNTYVRHMGTRRTRYWRILINFIGIKCLCSYKLMKTLKLKLLPHNSTRATNLTEKENKTLPEKLIN